MKQDSDGWITEIQDHEGIQIKLNAIKYNRNGNPFIIAEFNGEPLLANIGKQQTNLEPGYYDLICVRHNEKGYPYYRFIRHTDESWGVHDKVELEQDHILHDYQLLQHFREKLQTQDIAINSLVDQIEKQILIKLGEYYIQEMKEDELP